MRYPILFAAVAVTLAVLVMGCRPSKSRGATLPPCDQQAQPKALCPVTGAACDCGCADGKPCSCGKAKTEPQWHPCQNVTGNYGFYDDHDKLCGVYSAKHKAYFPWDGKAFGKPVAMLVAPHAGPVVQAAPIRVFAPNVCLSCR